MLKPFSLIIWFVAHEDSPLRHMHTNQLFPLPQGYYISTFFKWIICHENDFFLKVLLKMLKMYGIKKKSIDLPPKRICFVHC